MSIPKPCPNRFCRYLVRFGPVYRAEWYCLRDAHLVQRFAPWAKCPDYEPIPPDNEVISWPEKIPF